MAGRMKTMVTVEEKRERWDRRDPLNDQRRGERRRREQRKDERRLAGRRTDFCPTCRGELSLAAYCPSCKVRVIKIRSLARR